MEGDIPPHVHLPAHLKYPKYQKLDDETVMAMAEGTSYSSLTKSKADLAKTKPSVMLKDLRATRDPAEEGELVRPNPPEILEFLNVEDYSAQKMCAVPIEEPLFQPYPADLVFRNFEPFGTYHQRLYMRNNDSFARRVRVLSPDSPFFSIRPVFDDPNLAVPKNGKVAAGMEVCFIVTFRPREKRDYNYSLVCVTEREKFSIPVRAIGTRACLDFPDDIAMGMAPVKHTTTKTFLVRNVGEKATKFALSATAPFNVEPRNGFVSQGSSVQVTIMFTPEVAMPYNGELLLEYENGQTSAVALSGDAQNINVHLSSQIIEVDPAYISLSSQKTVKVFNRSGVPVQFSWKAFGASQEEAHERHRLHMELNRMEELEKKNLNTQYFEEEEGDADDYSDDERANNMPASKRRELASLTRKYKHLRRAVQEDALLFADENFSIEPVSGEVWANSELEFTITFSPEHAADYACVAFLETTGREQCLPLKIQATGIGPQASFTYDVLDIGDVFVNSKHTYELVMENSGEIDAEYDLQPSDTPFGPKFKFAPESGMLAVGEAHKIEVSFCSEILGEFSEHFHYNLKGSQQPLSVHFKGHVVGPTFHFDVEEIDFGIVSYEFVNTKTFTLYNTSEIPMTYTLRVPQDGKMLQKEFDIEPSTGTIVADGKVDIQVDFISTTVRVYEMYLTVDVQNVGEGLLSIPIKAECRLPDVNVAEEQIEYGSCFLRYPYIQILELVNDSDQMARYEILPQEEHTMILGTYETEDPKGTINAQSRIEVPITLTCEKLGKVNLPLFVKIAGQDRPPMNVALNANATGPNLILDKNEGINWGPTVCLLPAVRELTLTNDSLIPAPFRTFTKTQGSVYSVNINEGMLAPQESTVLKITAKLDDTIVHKDQLQIIVHEGSTLSVPLVARGEGTTLSCDDDISFIEYDYQFTSVTCEKRFFIKNLGRRAQEITWLNKTARENDEKAQSEFASAMKLYKEQSADKKKKKKSMKPPTEPTPSTPVFTVEPETVSLKPNTGCEFSFYGNTPLTKDFLEELVCEIKQGKEKKGRPVLSCKCHGIFINPVLEPSAKQLSYVYTWRDGIPLATQTQPITLRNVSELPLEFILRTAEPFSIDSYEFKLMPNETSTVNVTFDPGYRDDRVSHVAEGKLTAVYREHPNKDNIPLIGEINFPNLEFDYTTVDFGTCLNDTTQTVSVRVTNTSQIDTDLSWTFEADEDAARKAATAAKPYIPVNQVFDVLPIRSLLRPGESEVVEFAFYGHANRRFRTTCVGLVQGGPEYPIMLQGEAALIAHRIDQTYLDFGKVPYDVEDEVKEFSITNPGKVPFDFRLRLDELSRPGVVIAGPLSGKIYAGDKQKITVKFQPGIPDRIMETVKVDIAHFEPIMFPVYGHGIFTNIHVSLPREDANDEVWLATVEEARRAIEGVQNGDVVANRPPLPPAIVPPDMDNARPDTTLTTGRAAQKGVVPSPLDGTVELSIDNLPGSAVPAPPKTAPAMMAIPISGRKDSQETVVVGDIPAPPAEKDKNMKIQNEANRIVFMRFLLKQLENDVKSFDDVDPVIEVQDEDDPFAKTETKSEKPQTPVPKLSLAGAVVEAPSKNAMLRAKPIEEENEGGLLTVRSQFTPDFILAKYVCDFGHVVAGTVRKKKFSVTNTGYLPVTFTIDSGGAGSKGFHLDPEKVKNVPEGEEIPFKVTFKSKKTRLGPICVEVPVFLKDGPAIVIILKANVTIPDVSIHPDNGIDFGTVLLGRTKIINFQLKNLAPVPTTWSRTKQTKNGNDENFFICTPDVGTLAPGEAQNIRVHFTPVSNRAYDFNLPIKITSNPKMKTISLKGVGKELSVTFTPSRVVQVPVLPFADPTAVLVTAINDHDYPVEFFSLDFDEQYKEEETILREIDEELWSGHVTSDSIAKSHTYNTTMVVEPRDVGQSLPEKVMENISRKRRKAARREKRASRAAAKLAAQQAAKEAGEEAPADPADEENLDSTDEEDGGVGELEVEELPPTKREEGLALDVVFHGLPMTGSETIAQNFASEHGYTVIDIDEMVDDAIETNSLGGQAAKEVLGYSEGFPPADLTDWTLPNEILVAILQARIGNRDCGDGAVFPSLKSKYATEVNVASAIKVALKKPAITAKDDPVANAESNEEAEEVPLLQKAINVGSSLTVASGDLRMVHLTCGEDVVFADYINNLRISLLATVKEPEVNNDKADADAAKEEEKVDGDDDQPDDAKFESDPFVELEQSEIDEMSEEVRADYDKQKAKYEKRKGEEARELASNLLIQLEQQLADAAPDLNKSDADLAALDDLEEPEVAKSEYCKSRALLLYATSTGNVEEIKLAFGYIPPVEEPLAVEEPANDEEPLEGEEVDNEEEIEKEVESEAPTKEDAASSSVKEEAPAPQEALVEGAVDKAIILEVAVNGTSTDASLQKGAFEIIPPPPEAPEFVLPIPDPVENQILIKPNERRPRKRVANFKIVTQGKPTPIGKESDFRVLSEEDIANLADEAKANYEAELQERESLKSSSRWILPPRSQIIMAVEFASQVTGKSDCVLDFELMNSEKSVSISASGVCAVPSINKQPMVVFTRRSRGRPAPEKVHKRFVEGRQAYEFGPLLINKTRKVLEDVIAEATEQNDDVDQKTKDARTMALFDKLSKMDNADTMNISNAGLFDTRVDFTFRDSEGEPPSPFVIWPKFLDLPKGETKQISIWAFPETAEEHTDMIVCSVKDNPAVETFPLSCLGATPEIAIHGAWENRKTGEDAVDGEEDAVVGPIIDFDRLLLKRREAHDFTIVNTCAIPVAWRLALSENITSRSEFEVSPKNGVLAPGQSEFVTVNFEAVEPYKFDAEFITIEYSDTEGGLPPLEPIEGEAPLAEPIEPRIKMEKIEVRAEAYGIKYVIPEFGNTAPSQPGKKDAQKTPESVESEGEKAELEGGVLNFGALRVHEKAGKSFTLTNAGDYQIRFEFEIRRKSSAKLFSIEPTDGILESGGEQVVTLKFKSETEVNLKNNKDIRCSIFEPKTDEFFESFDLTTTVRSMFSSFRLQPLRGVNFSAVKYGQTVTRMIEIKNEGEFDFVYRVVDVLADDEKKKLEMQEASGQGPEAVATLKAARDSEQQQWLSNLLDAEQIVDNASLQCGPFTIESSNGVIVPGATARINLTFVADGSQLYRNPLRFDISGRAPNNQSGRSFEVVGESCIPGIDTESFESIFEEQSVVPRLEFVEVETDDPDYADGPKRVAQYAEEQGTFSFGAVVPGNAGKLGVAERLKISNHNKIKCVVDFSLTMRGIDEGKTEDSGAAFRIQPTSLELPPHENRYITVYFKPSEMRSYTAAFEANVVDGTEPRTRQLRFDVTGEGTLPCVTVEKPTAIDTDGSLLIDFVRCNAGKKKNETIILRNAGTVPATLYLDMELNNAFTFGHRGKTLTLPPRAVERLSVAFNPPVAQDEPFEAVINMTVMQNEYEATKIRLKGVGYLEDLAIEGLPGNTSDELDFGELDALPKASGKQMSFTLKNDQPEPIKFSFNDHEDFKFSPSIGHIHTGKSLEIVAEFYPTQLVSLGVEVDDAEESSENPDFIPVSHDKIPLAIKVQKVEYERRKVGQKTDEEIAALDDEAKLAYETAIEKAPLEMVAPWDNSQKSVVFNEEGEQSEEVAPEPTFVPVGDEKEIIIKLSGKSDFIRYECATNQVAFRPTMMFQTRSYKFSVSNTGATTISYDWTFENKNQKGSTLRLSSPSENDKGGLGSIALPFSISPQRGTISASGNEQFIVRFSPMEVPTTLGGVFNYGMRANIENLSEGLNDLLLDIRGAAQRPICHFELPSTTYLEMRPADLPGPSGNIGPLDPSVKVIFFESLGTNIKNTLRFKVINPTNIGYDFMWEAVGNPHPAFNNAIKSGTVLPGRRHEQIFEYTPSKNDANGYQESFWRFTIPQQGVDQLFLVAGTVLDPRISLDRTFVNFGSVLLGNPAIEMAHLINREDLPFAFNFDKSLLRRTIMSIDPMSGVVPANAKLPVKITFSPEDEKPENLSVGCLVRRKPTKLSLNLKGEGAGVHDTLTLFDDGLGADRGVELASSGINYVDFGQVHINDTVYKRVVIQNSGKFNLDFRWTAPKNPQLKISPIQGMVRVGDRLEVKIAFHPVSEAPLAGVKLMCDVAGTHKYVMNISGQGAKPMLDFSFIEHNFGPCFVPERGGAPMPETAILRLTNNEMENDVAFDCLFEKMPHLEVQTQPTMLRPTESIDIPIVFTARDTHQYEETIKFELNGLYTVNVIVRGEGCLLKLELANPTQSLVTLGTLRVGQDAVRKVLLSNKSKRAVQFSLEDVMEAGHGRLAERAVSFFPRGEITLAAKAKMNVEIRFNPLTRLSPFNEILNINCVGSKRKLLSVTGSCQGIEVSLESDAVPFGSICEGCRITKKLQMENSGDLGTKFKWDNASFGPDFSISPAEGFLSPHSGVVFDVMFHPTRIFDDFRRDRLMCMVDGAPPMFLTLSGACEEQPSDNIKELEFETRVREKVTQSITIENPTTSPWVIKPAITNEYWTGGTHLNIPAKGSGSYDVIYHPLTMTSPPPEVEDGTEPTPMVRHQGSVFFPLPDGTALLYKLFGTSNEPTVEDSFEKTAAAKEKVVFEFPVQNWMKKAQRFNVEWDDDNDRFRGAKTVDVPANGLRTYKLNFLGLKEGESFEMKVTFRNLENGEFLFYNIKANVTAAIIMGSVELNAPVRQTVQHVISIENPMSLEKEVTFEEKYWTCEDPSVRVRRLGEMTGKPECNFEVEYRPLVVVSEPKEVRLTITSPELGDYHYTLMLSSEAAASERALQFKAALGSSHVQTFRFRNMVQGGATAYKCVVGNPDAFEVPTTVTAPAAEDWEGVDVEVTISYEPIALGEVRDTLRVISDTGGEFVCSLYGNGVAPRPQGPFLIANGGSVSIDFKNVFNEAREFSFVVDSPLFEVNVGSQKLDANKPTSLSVKFKGPVDDNTDEFSSGKLYVSCPEIKALPPWIYYLRGQNQ